MKAFKEDLTEAMKNVDDADSPFQGNQEFHLEVDPLIIEPTPERIMPRTSTEELLSERGKTHGDFADHARITQLLKDTIKIELVRRHHRQQPRLTATQKESIDMILHKIGRIVAGESGFQDHWDDIAGYAKIARADV